MDDEQQRQSLPTTRQADFFDDGTFGIELATLDKPELVKRYTGEQLEARTCVRDAVVKALAEGVGILRIAKMLRAQGIAIGEHSIMALRDRRPDLVAIEKKQLSQQLGRISKLMADSIEERLLEPDEKKRLKPASVDLAIIIDKKASVDGEASMVIEHRHVVDDSAAAFARRIEEMKRIKTVQVIDVGAQDCESGENGQISEQKGE